VTQLPAPVTLRRLDRLVVFTGLAAATALAWAYTLRMAGQMGGEGQCASMVTGQATPWAAVDFGMAFTMWTVMMAGMMLPAALPVALAFAALNRGRGEVPFVPVGAFVGGYLLLWTAYSLFAAAAQGALQGAALLSPATLSAGPALGGGLLILAGIFQWTPWKDACMVHCRSPIVFLLSRWRSGSFGAFRMGASYGGYCLGCCWLLMALSFALGVMNLAWMAAVTAFMLLEKVAPGGRWITRGAGALLTVWGTGVFWRAFV
jgi:predicted metal-binding membrane protein